MIIISVAIAIFGLFFSLMLGSGNTAIITLFLCIGMALMGLTYGPLGTFLSELFPTEVRYSGTSIAFNFAGIIGAAFAPMIAIWIAKNYGLTYVGFYLSAAAILTLVSLFLISKKEHKF